MPSESPIWGGSGRSSRSAIGQQRSYDALIEPVSMLGKPLRRNEREDKFCSTLTMVHSSYRLAFPVAVGFHPAPSLGPPPP